MDTIPEAELPCSHVVVQQEKGKHGHRSLLTWVYLKNRKKDESGKENKKKKGARQLIYNQYKMSYA